MKIEVPEIVVSCVTRKNRLINRLYIGQTLYLPEDFGGNR